MTYRDRQVLEVERVLKPHQQQNVRPWLPFDLPAVEPLPESRWENADAPHEEESK